MAPIIQFWRESDQWPEKKKETSAIQHKLLVCGLDDFPRGRLGGIFPFYDILIFYDVHSLLLYGEI
jgi:hypothetical protein